MTLKDFPRGGRNSVPTSSNSLYHKTVKVNNEKASTEKENEQSYFKEYAALSSAHCLTYDSVMEGMIILGRVSTSTKYNLSISLPGRLRGVLPLTNIARTYNNLLQSFIDSGDDNPLKVKPLNELYKRGDYLVCYVKSMDLGNKHHITLSTEPELIYQNLNPTKLKKYNKVICSISSIEDHGYIVDMGMNLTRGFLSNTDIDNDVRYYPGQQIFCAIKSVKLIGNVATVKLSAKSEQTKSVVAIENLSMDAIFPNTSISVIIKNILPNGLHVMFDGHGIGFISQLHLKKPTTSYKQGASIIGKLLFVVPTTKLAHFSEILTEPSDESIRIGDIIEKAKFMYRECNGIVLQLKKSVMGFVSFRRTDIAFEEISSKFIPDSVHKCRVIAYDIFDRVYICSMERNILNETYIASENIKIGDIMTVEIMRINNENGFIFVKAGNILGNVAPEHVVDIRTGSITRVHVGARIKGRVLGKNKEGNGLLFTLKKSLVESELPILSNIDDAKIGSKFMGTITCINERGILVTFFNNVKGWVPSISLTKKFDCTMNFRIGQVVLVNIDKVNLEDEKLFLSIVQNIHKVKDIEFEIGEIVEGVVVESSINGAYVSILQNNNHTDVIGYLPSGHMAPCSIIATHLSGKCVSGQKVSAFVFSTSPDFLLTQTYLPAKEYTNVNKLRIGDCLPCSITEINVKTGLKVALPIKDLKTYGIVPLNRVDDNIEILFTHQILFGKIININKRRGEISLTTKLMDVWNEAAEQEAHMIGAVDQLSLYLSKLRELSTQPYYKGKAVSSLNLGERVFGVVDKVIDYGLVLNLDNGATGIIRSAHYKGTFNTGDRVCATVIWINYIDELAELTLMPILANNISEKQSKLPQTSLNTQLRGEVILTTNWFVLVVLKGQGKGTLAALPSRTHVNDVRPNLTSYTVGKRIRCYTVLNKDESEILPICLIKSAFELQKKIVRRKNDVDKSNDNISERSEQPLITKLKKLVCIDKESEYGNPEEMKITRMLQGKNIKRKIVEMGEAGSHAREGDDCSVEKTRAKRIVTSLSIPECGFFQDRNSAVTTEEYAESSTESINEDEGALLQPQKKKRKVHAPEKREISRESEKKTRELEESLIVNQIPNSADQFDRLVLASPDSSIIWLEYMAYHLQATEISKARAIAMRALKTINFREKNERLNVWQAWLNLESRFGTPESLDDVFRQAINGNESKSIHFHMLTVHADAGRHTELERVIKILMGKFKHLPQMWVEVGAALLKIGLKHKSRSIMQRALQSLPVHEHINLMVKFAQHENRIGDKERAYTLFEQILSSYPKRIDVWSAFVDSFVKSGDFEAARKVLKKAVTQNLPPRKMRILFKKLVNFEEQYGTPEGITHAHDLAVAYVDKQCRNEIN